MAFRIPHTGELNELVDLQKKTGTTAAPTALDITYPTVASKIACRVNEIFGGRVVEGVQVADVATHVVTMRYRSDVQTWDHIEYGPSADRRLLRVIRIMTPTGLRDWLEVLAQETRRGV